MKTLTFKTNINCGNCVRAVTPHLYQVEEIVSWRVDTDRPDKLLEVESQSGDSQEIINAVAQAGFRADLVA